MRRLASLLSGLLLLHLTLLGPDVKCGKHGVDHTQRSSQSDMAGHNHHTPAHDADMSDDGPIVPVCCKALASCGLGALDDPAVSAQAVAAVATTVRALADDVPPSWSVEPDSPPPKA